MSLDKFISGKPTKKKKKGNSRSLEATQNSKTKTKIDPSPLVEQSTPTETLTTEESPPTIQESNSTSVDQAVTEEHESITVEEDISGIIDEFKSKSKFELFQIIQDIVHTSHNYSRNKNLIARMYLDKKDKLSPEIVSEQLDISFYEVIVLLAEIKKELT